MKRTGFFIFTLLSLNITFAQNWKSLHKDAIQQADLGNFTKAIEISDRAISLANKDKKASHEEIIEMRAENAAYHLINEDVVNGMDLFKPLFDEAASGQSPEIVFDVYGSAAVAYVFLGMYQEALDLVNKAIKVMPQAKTTPLEQSTMLTTRGVCYQYLNKFTEAENSLQEALSYYDRKEIPKDGTYANLLSTLALLYKDMMLPGKAFDQFEKANHVYVSTGDTANPQYNVFLSDYATLLTDYHQYDRALSMLFRSRDMVRQLRGEKSFEYATAISNLGYVYSCMSKLVETEQFYEAAIKLEKELGYVRPGGYYTAISNLMVFYAAVGRKAEAKEMAAQLEEALRDAKFTDTLKRATFAHNLAVRYYDAEEGDKAERFYNDAVKYYTALYGPDNSHVADLNVEMGAMFQHLGAYNKSAARLNEAARIYSLNVQEENENTIYVLLNLAIIMRNTDQPGQARPQVDRALDIARKINLNNTKDLEQLYYVKGLVESDLQNVNGAMEYFNKFLDLKYKEIDKNFSYMTETEKMAYLDEFEMQIRNFFTTIINHMDKHPELVKALLDFRIKTKGFLLNNVSKIRQQIINRHDPALTEKFESLRLKREAIVKLMSFDTNEYPFALAEATELKKEADLLEKELSMKVSGFGGAKSFEQDWKSVQKNLLPGEAAIEIFQASLIYHNNQGKGTNYTYVILKDKGDPIYVSIDRTADWEDNVLSGYRASIDNKSNESELYTRLWGRVDEMLNGIHTLYISPDGVYNEVNINTLFNPQKNKYVIQDKEIHLVTSLRDIQDIKRAKPFKPQNCVLVGNPKFDYDISKLQSAPMDVSTAVVSRGMYGFVLSELPGTKTEVEVIKRTLEQNGSHAALFTEISANENAIKKINNPDVLHLATHGFFLEDPKEEDLAGYAKMEKEFYLNPMLRSGVFLSGANKSFQLNTANVHSLQDYEDGMLTAYEAMNLKLDQTELVVLSACQTGLGKVRNGEGVYGLQRAFKMAGTKAIIMSLWPVSDDATRDLMIAFYGSWTKHGDVYKAFREAQLETMKKYPDPYYWGAFVLVGR